MGRNVAIRWILTVLVVAGGATAQLPRGQRTRSLRRSNLAPEEQLRDAARIRGSIQSIRRTVSNLLDSARQENDVIKVACLNDKLNQIDVASRSAAEQSQLLETAIGVSSNDQRNHHHNLLVIYEDRVNNLDAEARACVGDETGVQTNREVVTLQVSNSIPAQEVDNYSTGGLALEVPNSTSAVR